MDIDREQLAAIAAVLGGRTPEQVRELTPSEWWVLANAVEWIASGRPTVAVFAGTELLAVEPSVDLAEVTARSITYSRPISRSDISIRQLV